MKKQFIILIGLVCLLCIPSLAHMEEEKTLPTETPIVTDAPIKMPTETPDTTDVPTQAPTETSVVTDAPSTQLPSETPVTTDPPTQAPSPTQQTTATPVPSYSIMYVKTGNTGKLNMRSAPNVSAAIVDRIANGTSVTVQSVSNGWAFVTAQGKTGYVMSAYLTNDAPVQPVVTVTPAPGNTGATQYVSTGNTGKLNLRSAPSLSAGVLAAYPNGTRVTLLSASNGWAQVYVPSSSLYGYMMSVYLSDTQPAVTPAPTQSGSSAIMYVRTGNSGRLNLREQMSLSSASLGLYPTGTRVTVYALSGDWARVGVNGQYGYMLLKYLSSSYVEPSSSSDVSVLYVKTGNSGRLHLRSYASVSAPSLGLFSNGTRVTVLSDNGTWARVRVDGMVGYMLRRYLSTSSSGSSSNTKTAFVVQPNGSYVNMRSSMSTTTSTNILYRLATGTRVEIIAEYGTWSKIRYSGKTGYMLTRFLNR